MPGVSGVHVMAYRQRSQWRVIERSGVLGGRILGFRTRPATATRED